MMFLFLMFSVLSVPYVGRYGRKQLTLWGTYGLIIALYLIAGGYFIA